MLRKLLLVLGFVMLLNTPLVAQNTHIEISYQSFRPFIHFQLDVNTYRPYADSYESVYLQGYMDGVNDEYFYGPSLVDIIRNVNAYRRGYRDGFRDRELLIRLRGHRWYRNHRFGYDDYYAPTLAVQIWLEGLSLAFLKAPEHRLPPRWQYRANVHVKKYRKWINQRSYRREHDNYYSSRNVERRFKKRIQGYRHKLQDAKKRNRRSISHDPNKVERKRSKRIRRGVKSQLKSWINRSTNRSDRTIKKRDSRKKRVRQNRDNQTRSRGNINQKQKHNRGNVDRGRKRNSDDSKRKRSRRGNRDRDG